MKPSDVEVVRQMIIGELEECGPKGLSFRQVVAAVKTRYPRIVGRFVQDVLHKLEQSKDIRDGGMRDGVRVYVSSMYPPEEKVALTDREEIHAFRDLKTLFPGLKPGRFDVR